MKTLFGFLFSFLFIFSSFSFDQTWEKINEKDGIEVFRKYIKGRSVAAFGGKTIIEAPIEKVFWVISDNTTRKDWVDRLVVSEVIENPGPFEKVMYQEFSLPWPLSNREFIYRASAKKVVKKESYRISMNDLSSHPNAPKIRGVKAEMVYGFYLLTRLGPNQTEVSVEILSDPHGLLPAWLVNVIQKNWPVKTLSGISKQVKKPFVQMEQLPKS